ncbi:MAG: hypothetical protein ACREB3_11180 [Burkholderiales bacterium]
MALRAMVAALSRHRAAQTRRVFFKLDSWHTLSLALFRKAFPKVPWIFLYRDPIEVMVSQAQLPSRQAIAGVLPPMVTGIEGGGTLSLVDHCAIMLKSICTTAVEHLHGGGKGIAIDYRDLRKAALDRIPRHFGFTPTNAERLAMDAAALRNAKYPSEAFGTDGEAKRKTAGPEMIAASDTHLVPAYRQLEKLSQSAHASVPNVEQSR